MHAGSGLTDCPISKLELGVLGQRPLRIPEAQFTYYIRTSVQLFWYLERFSQNLAVHNLLKLRQNRLSGRHWSKVMARSRFLKARPRCFYMGGLLYVFAYSNGKGVIEDFYYDLNPFGTKKIRILVFSTPFGLRSSMEHEKYHLEGHYVFRVIIDLPAVFCSDCARI